MEKYPGDKIVGTWRLDMTEKRKGCHEWLPGSSFVTRSRGWVEMISSVLDMLSLKCGVGWITALKEIDTNPGTCEWINKDFKTGR